MATTSQVISSEIQYKIDDNNHGDVIYRYLYPQNSQSATLSAGGVYGPTSIVLPPSCFNLAKSSLNFQIYIPVPTAGYYNYINANTATVFSRIKVFDQFSNAIWCDVSNFNQVASLVIPSATKVETFLTRAFFGIINTDITVPSNAIQTSSPTSQLYPVEDLGRFMGVPQFTAQIGTTATSSAAVVATYFPPSNFAPAGSNTSIDLFVQNPYTARRQFYIGAQTSASYLDVNLPLSALKFTVGNMDKLVWNASNLQMDLYWNSTDNFCFQGNNVANPSSVATTIASVAAGALINNITLVLANENNLSLISQVVNLIKSEGVKIQIPWMTATKQNQNNAAPSYQIALSSAYGNSLLAVITAPFQPTTSGSYAPYSNVHQRGTLTNYNTFINNISIANPSYYNVLQGQDYMVGNRKFLRGSVVQTLGEYIHAEWLHVDSWFGTKPLHMVDCQEVDGLDLTKQNAVWQWQSTLSAQTNYSWLSILVGQKTLQLTSQGSLVF